MLFDNLMARREFKPHPNKISSVLFYLASLITHGEFVFCLIHVYLNFSFLSFFFFNNTEFHCSHNHADIFRTDHQNRTRNLTSSYLDLSPLYGSNQEEQNAVRTFKDGKLKPDSFSEKRVLAFPPGVCVLLIMFNRFHNFIAQGLAAVNEGNRFPRPYEIDSEAYNKFDNDVFQTARLVTCGLYINIILKDYVRTILNIVRTDSGWGLDPRSDIENIKQASGNQVSAEFNLVYRWHSCISKRDNEWMQDKYRQIFPDKDPNEISLSDFSLGLAKWQSTLAEDPQERTFENIQRLPNGSFNDEDLVEILTTSIEDCAGSFDARHVPTIFRTIEIMGIEQARSWNLSTLNEFRAHFNLVPHKTFEDINSDPYVAEQLKHFYGNPDNVELYPGLVIEDAKDNVVPGSGLCTNFTISRAILSDAVALVRGDRFYTVDYTSNSLTNWGWSEAKYDLATDHGHVFYKLFLRAFPNHFQPNSIYAHYPLTIPSENKKILGDLGVDEKYTWERPVSSHRVVMISSHAACKTITEDKQNFKVTWGKAIEFMMHRNGHLYGRDYMLSGDESINDENRKMMDNCLHYKDWHKQIKEFYEKITLRLLHEKSYKVAGASQVDIVRDVANLAQVHFSASVFSLPLKTRENPLGIYTEYQLYDILALILIYIFFDADPAKSFPLQQASRKYSQQLGEFVMLNVELIKKTGWLPRLIDRFRRNELLPGYGVHMIRRLLDTGLPADEIVWTHLLPTSGGMVANQSQLFCQCLDYYLSEEGSPHLQAIQQLSRLDTKEADDLLMR